MYDGGVSFQLGDPLTGGSPNAQDLPRFRERALIGDPRNDENSIVSQLQGLFLRFHNRMVVDNPHLAFDEIQQLVRFHYQYVVLNDFLPRIVGANILDALKTDGRYDQKKLRFFHWRHDPFMPVEFSVAAYRLGHSMIRPGYRLNDGAANLLPIFADPNVPGQMSLAGFQTMASDRAIDWGRFIDIDIRAYDGDDATKQKRLQFAYRIDTSVVGPLGTLPPSVASHPASLAERNLHRSLTLGLPSGQVVARAMGLVPLTDAQIIIGKAVDVPDPADGPVLSIIDAVNAKGGPRRSLRWQLPAVDLYPRRSGPQRRRCPHSHHRHHRHPHAAAGTGRRPHRRRGVPRPAVRRRPVVPVARSALASDDRAEFRAQGPGSVGSGGRSEAALSLGSSAGRTRAPPFAGPNAPAG